MSKRTRKTSKARKPSKPKGQMGGARPGSGPKPKLGAGIVRGKIKTLRLSDGESTAQLAAAKRSGAEDWATWARPILNSAAAMSAMIALPAAASRDETVADESARAAALEATRINSMTGEPSTPDDPQSYTDSSKIGAMSQRGAVVGGTDPCVCGHAPEEHGRNPAHPGSTACCADLGAEGCDCAAYEADPADDVAGGAP